MSSWQMFVFGGGKCPNLGVVNVLLANDSQSFLTGFDIDIQLKAFFKLGKFLNANFSVPRLDIANGREVSLVTFSMQN